MTTRNIASTDIPNPRRAPGAMRKLVRRALIGGAPTDSGRIPRYVWICALGLAAIWETAVDPDGGEIDTLAILTAPAGPDMRSLHSREPVVIAAESYKLWLEADERDAAALQGLLAPAPANFWSAWAVSTEVNSPRHDGPQLLEPAMV